jgi:hypothetical protein
MMVVRDEILEHSRNKEIALIVESAITGVSTMASILGLPLVRFEVAENLDDRISLIPLSWIYDEELVVRISNCGLREESWVSSLLLTVWQIPMHLLVHHHDGSLCTFMIQDWFSKPPILLGFVDEAARVCRVERLFDEEGTCQP